MGPHQLSAGAARAAIEDARIKVAALVNARPEDVVFTSGGSENENIAIRGLAQLAWSQQKPFTLITSPVEHTAVSVTGRQLHDVYGISLRVVSVDRYGRVDPDDLRATLQNLPADGMSVSPQTPAGLL